MNSPIDKLLLKIMFINCNKNFIVYILAAYYIVGYYDSINYTI